MGDSCPLKGTKLTSPMHILLCMAIEYEYVHVKAQPSHKK